MNIQKYKSMEIFVYYRYLSIIITSLFFIFFTGYTLFNKAIIIILIIIASVILNYLYYNVFKDKNNILVLLSLETFYTALIIMVTGGLNSPFMWYIFNSIIICFLIGNIKYGLICLFVYILSGTILPYLIFNKNYAITINSNILLGLILITGLLYVLYECIEDINEKNSELSKANLQTKQSMNHIIQLYNTMHTFTEKNNLDDIINQLIEYSYIIYKPKNIIFFTKNNNLSYKDSTCITNIKLLDYISKNYQYISNIKNVLKYEIDEELYILYPIKYNLKVYGILVLNLIDKNSYEQDSYDSLIYISELASIVLEKFELEKVNNDLIINEEQNRIANDIHDGVLQRLFSISCLTYTLYKNVEVYDSTKIKTNLNIIRNSINNSMTDLRKTIYKLSLNKDGNNTFISSINDFIKEIEEFNDASVILDLVGDTELLSMIHKKSIYKIICELVSNSIRHGKASKVNINISINNNILITFIDNGIGFNYEEIVNGKKCGLGLKNIEHLINIVNGSLKIKSKINEGTIIDIIVPLCASQESKIGV